MKLVATVMAVMAAVCFVGCASKGSTTPPPTVPPPLVQQLSGPASEVYPYSLAQTETATVNAMKGMGITIVNHKADELGSYIEGMTPGNAPVYVNLVMLQYATQVNVKYGLYGDTAQGQRLLNNIPGYLPEKK